MAMTHGDTANEFLLHSKAGRGQFAILSFSWNYLLHEMRKPSFSELILKAILIFVGDETEEYGQDALPGSCCRGSRVRGSKAGKVSVS